MTGAAVHMFDQIGAAIQWDSPPAILDYYSTLSEMGGGGWKYCNNNKNR